MDGAELCTRCGACCGGVLHAFAYLDDDEVERAREQGLRVRHRQGGAELCFPCSRLEGKRCGVYPERPRVCGEYRCSLLSRFEAGQVPLAEALERVARFEAATAAAQAALGALPDADALAALRQRELSAEDPAAFRREHAELLLALGRLRAAREPFVEEG